mgnify:FL=1
MDWDQLATVAQLVTGAATLLVAVFLWNQLRVQHRDSERNFVFANEERQQELLLSIFGDEGNSDLYWKAAHSYESLTPDEDYRYRYLAQLLYVWMWNAWRIKRDGEGLERFEYQWQQMLEFPGQRRFHENWGRRLLSRDPSMLQFVEGVYEELESQGA